MLVNARQTSILITLNQFWTGKGSNIVIVSIPIEQIHPISAAIDKSTAGTAKTSEKFGKIVDKIRFRRV